MKVSIGKYVPDADTRSLLLKVYDSGNLVQGQMVENFEQMCCEMSGAKYAAAVSNGTVAIEMMLGVQEPPHMMEVITNPLSFVATKNAIKHAGATPIFLDVDYETGMLDEDEVYEYVTSNGLRSKSLFITPVDLHGERDPIAIADYWKVPVLRDSSQAHGQQIKNTDTAMSFSFHASKNATSGEGGVIVSNDENLIEEIKIMRNHGMDANKNIIRDDGYNARMTDLQAAIGIGSLIKLQDVNSKRTENAHNYDDWFNDRFNEDQKETLKLPQPQNIYHHYVLRHPRAYDIVNVLRYEGVDARRYYSKLISPPVQNLPNAQRICEESFCIPVHEHLTRDDLDYVYESVLKAVRFVQYD